MTKLKLAPVEDDKPVKLTVTLSAKLHRNLVAYVEISRKGNRKAGRGRETDRADVGEIYHKRPCFQATTKEARRLNDNADAESDIRDV